MSTLSEQAGTQSGWSALVLLPEEEGPALFPDWSGQGSHFVIIS
jgi:hypothetical protein